MEINKDPLPELIQQLSVIKAVMCRVHENKQVLNMYTWVYHDTCGTAACVMGHVALDENPDAHEDKLNEIASEHASRLNNLVYRVFDNSSLAYSVWKPMAGTRRQYAILSGLFSAPETKKFNHLTEKEPTAHDVVNYLDAIITKLEAKK